MIIHVTQEDINQGIKVDCTSCPVALALRRKTGKAFSVSLSYISLFEKNQTFKLDLPVEVSEWIQAFDYGEKVRPFEFAI